VGEPVIKQVGDYEAVVKCYKDIKATVKLQVVGEEA
jgi:ribosomal protein L9